MFDAKRINSPLGSDRPAAAVAAAPLNPFAVLGGPCSPMRMMFAPLEIALFLPAYAFESFHGNR